METRSTLRAKEKRTKFRHQFFRPAKVSIQISIFLPANQIEATCISLPAFTDFVKP